MVTIQWLTWDGNDTVCTRLLLKFISPWPEIDSNIRVDRTGKHTVLTFCPVPKTKLTPWSESPKTPPVHWNSHNILSIVARTPPSKRVNVAMVMRGTASSAGRRLHQQSDPRNIEVSMVRERCMVKLSGDRSRRGGRRSDPARASVAIAVRIQPHNDM